MRTGLRRCVFLVAVVMLAGGAASEPINCAAAEHPEIGIWPNGLPADAKPVSAERVRELEGKLTDERIFWVETPSLTLYRAPKNIASGCSVVICPGGGYNILAWPKEGLEVAEWFNSIGVTAAVLKYRVPRRDPDRPHHEPLQDAQRAIRLMRHNAKEWGVDPGRVGILGFSAGGHLTVMAGTHWDRPAYPRVDDADDLSCRPDFMCPIYAAYLGNDYKDNVAEIGPLVRLTKETPPTFLAVTADDSMRGVQSALLFVELRKLNVPAEVHVYAKGGHGYGIRESDKPVSTWHHRLGDWLKSSGLLERK
ncbi:alpha/beta hydrolase fold domain-containing protein [bacterium]|nr:alpha/beta hydrolase fold domain-containing protein [bacterium]